ncbi:cell division protein [Wigglesworthia glossinidia endosymbiont of Glossina morsitans morsitans (Yale colony)]|uniref:Cell division protein FtsB n=1 Tax=Wigglesworthia glossinidia endosymbiont of Glossina morsitans morsitans (Yale colony) TaxID=1142511 RepID=H6Q4K4_WIGGL|nr:septum formation initiator family protein [Wigglesworthia glossinidia]AFA41064.1 cell division protein [Wigglesworthia glossinidia endosymbiont of Glossina morsitans morsitans (Yale colony)]
MINSNKIIKNATLFIAHIKNKKIEYIFLFIFFYLQSSLWYGKNNIMHLIEVRKEIKIQSEKNLQKKMRNQKLIIEINYLKNKNDAIEERARNELNMIKSNEVYYRIIEVKNIQK